MAKVPQYKSQTAPVKTAGQAMLNAFANPQTVSSGIRAAQQTLNSVQDIGMKIFEHELKQSRATAAAEKSAEFEKWIEKTNNHVVSGPPSTTTKRKITNNPALGQNTFEDVVTQDNPLTAIGKIKKSSRAEIRRIASTINDPVAKRRFITAANKRLADVSPGITKNLRMRYNDHANAVAEVTVRNYVKRGAGETQEQRAKTKLEITNHYLGLVDLGQMKKTTAVTRTYEALSRLDSGVAQQMMSEAIRAKDPSKELENLTKFVANKDNLTDLSTAARARLVTQLFKARESVDRRIETDARRVKNEGIKQDTKAQKKFKSEIYGKYEDFWEAKRKGQDVERPYTSNQLREFETDGKLPPGSAEGIIKFSENEGKEQNIAAVNIFRKRIANAITEQELENIRTEIQQAEDIDEISPRSLSKLDALITRLQPKTPEEQDDKKYLRKITSILKGNDKGIEDTRKHLLMSDADGEELYDSLREGGMRPYEAYVQTMTDALARDEKFMQKVLGGVPSEFRQKFMRDNGKMERAKKWKPEMVTDMEARWKSSLENKGRDRADLKLGLNQVKNMTKKERLSVRSLYRTEVAIRAIKEYMTNRVRQTQ